MLEQNGTEVKIEKEEDNNNIEVDLGTTVLQFISNGLAQKTKYDLHFDFGEQRNEKLLKNKIVYNKFKEELIEKLSKDFNIPKNKIIVTFPQKGSFSVQVIFQSDDFNKLNENDFINKFKNDNNYPELKNLKEVHTDVIMEGCKLSRNQLDPIGNRIDWPICEERRGKKPYNAPVGWIGIVLKVKDKYDNGNNIWIEMCNIDGEWYVAYHGVGRNKDSKTIKDITGKIIKSEFKAGPNQIHEAHKDIYHPGKKVGNGVYCTPSINTADFYSGISVINGERYKTVLMVRVKPETIRGCSDTSDYWVVDGTTNEIRPYRILYKKC